MEYQGNNVVMVIIAMKKEKLEYRKSFQQMVTNFCVEVIQTHESETETPNPISINTDFHISESTPARYNTHAHIQIITEEKIDTTKLIELFRKSIIILSTMIIKQKIYGDMILDDIQETNLQEVHQ